MIARWFLYVLICGITLAAQSASTCPTDTAALAHVTNTAAGVTADYAGYTFLTVSGLNMPTGTRAISALPPGGVLTKTMGGVTVLVNGLPAYLFSYTTQQILFLLPRIQPNSCLTLYVEANGVVQFQAQFFANATAPGMFTYADGQTIIASHADWSLVTTAAPAHSGEWISLWAAGLGLTNPDFEQSQTAVFSAELADKASFSVLLNGLPVDPSRIGYAGIAPGYAGLYQINVLLPPTTPVNPEIRLRTADNISPAGRFLAVQ